MSSPPFFLLSRPRLSYRRETLNPHLSISRLLSVVPPLSPTHPPNESIMSTDQNMADYSYTPSLVMAMIFIAIFGGSSLVHLVQTCKSTRQKWMCCFALGGITNNRSAWVVGEGVVALQSGGGRVPRPDQFANYWTNFLLCRAVHAFGRGDPPSRLHVGFHVGQGVQEHLCNSRRRVPPPPSRRRWNRAAATTADHQNLGSNGCFEPGRAYRRRAPR